MKKDVIRKWDVIFFEEELGHEILESSALRQGVSIAGKVPRCFYSRKSCRKPATRDNTERHISK